MEKHEFLTSMERMKKTYGDQKYPVEREAMIWSWAKRMNAKLFDAVCSELIAEFEHAPMIGKFKDTYSKIKPRFQTTESAYFCVYCVNSGMILVGELTGIAWACHCEYGQRVPAFVSRHQGPWIRAIPTQSELNWRDVKNVVVNTMKSIPKELK